MRRIFFAGVFLLLSSVVYGQDTIPAEIQPLLTKYLCVACHKLEGKLIGPGYIELSSKSSSAKEIGALIVQPNPANWPGYPPMAAMPHLPKEDVEKIAGWIFSLKSKQP
jgi:cytochrome c